MAQIVDECVRVASNTFLLVTRAFTNGRASRLACHSARSTFTGFSCEARKAGRSAAADCRKVEAIGWRGFPVQSWSNFALQPATTVTRESGAHADSPGRAKRVVSITPKGRAQLAESVRGLLRSGASVYFDRIVGLAMSAALPGGEARQEIAATMEFLSGAIRGLDAYREAEAKSMTSALVIGFYGDVLRAERRACEAWMARAARRG